MKAVLGVLAVVATAGCALGGDDETGGGDPALARDGDLDSIADGGGEGPPDACVPQSGGERCNGADDDCDGEIDEGFPGVGVECDVGIGACERSGFTVCDQDGLTVVCA